MKNPKTPEDPANDPSLRPGRGGIVPPPEHRFRKGQPSPNPGGRPKGVSITEATQILLKGGSMPNGKDRTPAWRIAARMLEDAEAGDPRTQSLVLERTEGRVPLPAQNEEVAPGVVLLPVAKMETEAWARLAEATFGDRYNTYGPALPPKPEERQGD